MKPTLPKAERAVIAAHEAGMHERKPTPATCRDCALEAQAEVKFLKPIKAADPVAAIAAPAPKPKRVNAKPYAGPSIDDPTDAIVDEVKHPTREAWMLAAVETFRPWFEDVEAPVGPVRVSVGFPGGRGSSKAVGQCWMPQSVADAVPAIFVSPVQHDPLEILETILHEMVHASGQADHRRGFASVARAIGLTPPWRKHPMTDELRALLTPVAAALGPFGHAEIKTGVDRLGSGRKVQSTRMLKIVCPEDGYTVRTTRKWIEVGLPSCPDGHPMEEAKA